MNYGNPNPYVPTLGCRITEDTDIPTIPTTTPIARPITDVHTSLDQPMTTTMEGEDIRINMVEEIERARIASPA